jgi:acyl transferase domain-containing protein/NAD(P)-dependent dehydrogenase (short-subunit alcohol dehydrogenase family)
MSLLKKLIFRPKNITSDTNDIAIIGMSCRFPGADNYNEYWQNLSNGINSVREITPDRWDIHAQYLSSNENFTICKWGGLLKDISHFDADFFQISPREAQSMDPQQRILLEEAWHCIEDAGIELQELQAQTTDVYVAVSANDYQHYLFDAKAEIDSYACLGNYYSILANRLSFFLKLTGKSTSIDAACAGSLVAIHEARSNLLAGKANYAITAGVHVICHPGPYIALSKSRILSPDGQCKTFDKEANGYVPGEGIGVLLLTPLQNALAKGYKIHGILKGSAVNHCGKPTSITAPNIQAQKEVIIAAQNAAKIKGEDITYIEAHGTGTSLGDPIEVEGLTQAFRISTNRKGFCGIGSVKTNIGHLEAAAGFASVIKTLLMMQHQKFVPTLNISTINPLIDLENSPFFVTKNVQDWKLDTQLHRYAGVSSFGFGGVNAHVVLEEYLRSDENYISADVGAKNKYYPFVLSAKSKDSLQSLLRRWQDYVNSSDYQHQKIEDISYTLLKGREIFSYRLGLWVTSTADLAHQLQSINNIIQDKQYQSCPVLVINTIKFIHGHDFFAICEQFPALRLYYDNCCRALRRLQKRHFDRYFRKRELNKCTQVTFEFVVMYCCASYLYELGLKTSYVCGIGIGRVVAAVVSGLLSLEDGLAILLASQCQNSSQDIKVKFNAPNLPFFDDIDSKMIYPVAIDIDTCQKLREKLKVEGVVLERLKEKALVLYEKQYTFRSYINEWNVILQQEINLTFAELCTNKQIGELNKTAGELVLTILLLVCFKKLRNKWSLSDNILIEQKELIALSDLILDGIISGNLVIAWLWHGDNDTSTKLVERLQNVQLMGTISMPLKSIFPSQQVVEQAINVQKWIATTACQSNYTNALKASQDVISLGENDSEQNIFCLDKIELLPQSILTLWSKDLINKKLIGIYDVRGKVTNLPLYCFTKQHYWLVRNVTATNTLSEALNSDSVKSNKKIMKHLSYYIPSWKNVPLGEKSASNISEISCLWVMTDDTSLVNALRNLLATKPVIQIRAGSEYQKINDMCYQIQVGCEGSYKRLIESLEKAGYRLSHYVWFRQINDVKDNEVQQPIEYLANGLQENVMMLRNLLHQKNTDPVCALGVYLNNKLSKLIGQMLVSFVKSIRQEYTHFQMKLLHFDTALDSVFLATLLKREFAASIDLGIHIKYINGINRQVEHYEKINPKYIFNSNPLPLRRGGVYLITGGLGKLGYIYASYLASTYQAKLILTGREILNLNKQRLIDNLIKAGSKVIYLSGDVSQAIVVKQWIDIAKEKFSHINGLIHCAGTFHQLSLVDKRWLSFESMLSVKICGAINLDMATQNDQLDCFIMFSSISACLGVARASDYAIANTALNIYSNWRTEQVKQGKRHGKTISINWPYWEEGGMQLSEAALQKYQDNLGLWPLPTSLGIQAFEQILHADYPNVAVFYGEPEKFEKILNNYQLTENTSVPVDQVNTSYTELKPWLIHELAKIVSESLKLALDKISANTNLSEYGFDSITLTEFSQKIDKKFKTNTTPALFFTYTNLTQLADYLIQTFNNELLSVYQFGQSALSSEVIIPVSSIIKEPITEQLPKQISVEAKSVKSINTNKHEPIAIIGVAGLFPQCNNIEELWERLVNGDNLITEIPPERWDWQKYYDESGKLENKSVSKWGGFIPNVDKFDAAFFNISPREAELMDPQHRLFLQTVWHAIEDSGYAPESTAGKNIGLYLGVQFNEYQSLAHDNNIIFHPAAVTGNSHAMLVNRISYLLDWHGPSEAINTACSSSLVAVHHAVQTLRSEECEFAVVGGVSLMLSPETVVYTSKLGVLSPEGACKTFDAKANGFVKGEGVIAIVLKPLSKALADNDNIQGVILSSAVNHGGRAQSLTAPNAQAQAELLIKAYQQADIDPETITYIETHGTGTQLGDPVEIEGIKQAFKKLVSHSANKNYCGLGSVKTNIGHLEPAAGIAGIVKVLLAMRYEKLPGLVHFNQLNPYIQLNDSPFYIVTQKQDWQRKYDELNKQFIPRRAGVSSFGFGGANAHVLLEEPPVVEMSKLLAKPSYLIVLSAKTENSLQKKIKTLLKWLERDPNSSLEEISYTLNMGRGHYTWRCALVIDSLATLKTTLESLDNQVNADNIFVGQIPDDFRLSPMFKELVRLTQETIISQKLTPNNYYEKLLILGDLYVHGCNIDWQVLYQDERVKRISLPTYPFAETKYWIEQRKDKDIVKLKNDKLDSEIISNSIIERTSTEELFNQADLNSYTLSYLKEVFSQVLKLPVETFQADKTYEAFGVDSLMGLEIIKRLEQDLGSLSKTLLFEKKCLKDLSAYLQASHRDALSNLATKKKNIIEEVTAKVNDSDVKIIETASIIKNTKSQHEIEQISGDIAIIGLSGKYPLADDIDTFWRNLVEGKNCVTSVPAERWNPRDYPIISSKGEQYFDQGGFINDVDKFDPLFFNIAPADAVLIDPQERLFMQAAWTVMEDAGYTRKRLAKVTDNRVGVFVGSTFNYYPLLLADEWKYGNKLQLNIQQCSIANRVSYFLNLNGPSYVVDTACSSSLVAIHQACQSILNSECIMAIAGGVNLSLHPSKYHMLASYGFLSDHGRCKSFSEEGNGYVPSEGVGAVLLKPLALAVKDNDRIYAIIKASSINHGGKTSGYTVPNPAAQAELIKSAIRKAKIDPRSITYIEAHGTGTKLGDPIEIKGLQTAFEEYTQDKQFCAVGSVKSNIGHLEAAAGISQLTKVILQLKYKKIVPTLYAQKINPYIDFANTAFYVQTQLKDWQALDGYPRRAGISSFGAGGTNAHVIIEEYIKPAKPKLAKAAKIIPKIFIVSATNDAQLKIYVKSIYDYLLSAAPKEDDIEAWLKNVCYTLQIGRESMRKRLAILVNNYDSLMELLKQYLHEDTIPEEHIWYDSNATISNEMILSDESMDEIINGSQYNILINEWMKGCDVLWEKLYENEDVELITLPTYPFAKRRCWIQSHAVIENLVHKKQANINAHSIKAPQHKQGHIDIKKCGYTQEEIIEMVLNKAAIILGLKVNDINPELPFQDYGMDSMNGMKFINELSIDFPEFLNATDIYNYPTCKLLAEYIFSNQKNQKLSLGEAYQDNLIEFSSDTIFEEVNNLSEDAAYKQLLMELEETKALIN